MQDVRAGLRGFEVLSLHSGSLGHSKTLFAAGLPVLFRAVITIIREGHLHSSTSCCLDQGPIVPAWAGLGGTMRGYESSVNVRDIGVQ